MFFFSFLCSAIPDLNLGILKMLILVFFGQKLQHFSNDAFQSYYEKDHSMTGTRRLKNVVIFAQTI